MWFKRCFVPTFACFGALLAIGCSEDYELSPELQLLQACDFGNLSAVEELLDQGVSANGELSMEGYPLYVALGGGHTEIADVLVDHGASVNARLEDGLSLLDTLINASNETENADQVSRFETSIDWLYENGARRRPE